MVLDVRASAGEHELHAELHFTHRLGALAVATLAVANAVRILRSRHASSELVAVAWMLLPPAVRPVFRDACGAREPVDDALWARARGWALVLGVAMSNGDERVAAIGRRTLAAVLADR